MPDHICLCFPLPLSWRASTSNGVMPMGVAFPTEIIDIRVLNWITFLMKVIRIIPVCKFVCVVANADLEFHSTL